LATIKHYKKDCLTTGEFDLVECDSVAVFIMDNIEKGEAFSVFKGKACQENLIPNTPEDLISLGDGEYSIIETPAGAQAAFYIISLVVAVAVVALAPKPELPSNVNRSQESPNNRLSSRSNQARPLQRVPDIKGQVRAIPDIAMPTYSTYENNIEIENGFYCVGRKQYQIDDIRDGDTPLELINGASAGIYYPNNNPNIGAPDVQIGNPIEKEIVIPYRSNQVDGITLATDFDDAAINAALTPVFLAQNINPNYLSLIKGGEWDGLFSVGSDAVLTDVLTVGSVDISGNYEIIDNGLSGSGLGFIVIDFGQPVTFLPDSLASGIISSSNTREFTDWAYITKDLSVSAIFNVIAPNGIYLDDGSVDLLGRSVAYQFQIEPLDESNQPSGVVETINQSIYGNNQRLYGYTTEYEFSVPTKFRARAKRTTPRYTGAGSVSDEIKWADLYGITKLDDNHDFGNVTTIQTKTLATPFATAVKERQLNCLATEMLYQYQGSGVFSNDLTANKTAVQSLITDTIDPVIGNRTLNEIDADGLIDLNSDIINYFGLEDFTEFSYTFDSTEITYQDYAQQLLDAINCIGYRDGSVIKAVFEKPKSIPAALFTHRSKIPNSERYTRNFNRSEIPDGIEFNWVDPDTDTTETIFLPSDRTAVNPRSFNIAGIRNQKQATIRAFREFNKIKYRKMTLDVTVTAEGRYVLPNDMFACVKGTRTYTEDGEVIAQDGLLLTLSQDVNFIDGDIMSITLKNRDGTTENILCTNAGEDNQLLLNSPPITEISTGIDSRRTEFSFGNDARNASELWLAQEIDISEKISVNLKAINYTSEYYKDDQQNLSSFNNDFNNDFG